MIMIICLGDHNHFYFLDFYQNLFLMIVATFIVIQFKGINKLKSQAYDIKASNSSFNKQMLSNVIF